MLFKPELAMKVVYGSKTQTRRVVAQPVIGECRDGDWLKDGTVWSARPTKPDERGHMGMNYTTARSRFTVGRDYAVQPGWGKRVVLWTIDGNGDRCVWPYDDRPAHVQNWKPARIRITDIRREDVRMITPEDAKAEGFERVWEFLHTWCQINDKTARWDFDPQQVDYWINTGRRRELVSFQTVQQIVLDRPLKFYDAWAITFELVA